MVAVGIPFAVYDMITLGRPYLIAFIYSVVFTSALSYLFFKFNFFGGADAKCLMAISVLIPYYHTTPIPDLFPFAITTLLNAAIVSVTVPVFLFLYNLLRLNTKRGDIAASFTGYPVPIADLERKRNLRLVHRYEEEGEKRKYIFLKGYHEQGKIEGKVWVTPELPFLLFITAGFFISILYGNLIFGIMFVYV
jgi:preflagellin peptidase FlaK